MDFWDKSLGEYQSNSRHRRENPSFSSTLLDSIYRSIDETKGEGEDQLIFYRETMKTKQRQSSTGLKEDEEEMANFRRACLIEKWVEKKSSEKVFVRRNSMADFDIKARNVRERDFKWLKSSSSSSESSCGGGFSSSESESFNVQRSKPPPHSAPTQRPKPIRTTPPIRSEKTNGEAKYSVPNPQQENGFAKTKSKAMKIYSDLKKVKQPISPGGRLSSFLNSLFNGGSPKKPKFSNSATTHNEGHNRKSKSAQESTCSSASSFSRSCLSKTPSSSGKLSNNVGSTKRTVRFCPVSVIVDEESRPCGHKDLHEDEPVLMAVTALKHCLAKNNHFQSEKITGNLLNSYPKKNGEIYACNIKINNWVSDNEEEDDDDDDGVSCSSSDLFELENLSSIGIQRYSQELPVYETTRLESTRPIANGFSL